MPCCSPVTNESVAVVRDKVSDTRADLLVGHGQILKSQGDYTSSILQNVGSNSASTNSNVDRLGLATMSQIDKYGLAGINTTNMSTDKISSDINKLNESISNQNNNIAWNNESNTGRRFGEMRSQNERINDAQSAYSDRAFKYNSSQNNDNFSRMFSQASD